MVDLTKSVQEFEQNRIQLMNVTAQKQQLQFQSNAIEKSLKELEKNKEEKVYKAVGNILILSDSKEVDKELKDQKESLDLRVKTFKKQEEDLVDKLNKLKSEIEAGQKAIATAATKQKK